MSPEVKAVLDQIEVIRKMDCGLWLQHTTKGEDARWKIAQELSRLYTLLDEVNKVQP